MTERESAKAAESIISAADVVDDGFCCPLIGVYPCERERRGCYCHELYLINVRYAEGRAANITETAAFLDRLARLAESSYSRQGLAADCREMAARLRGKGQGG